jgi:adenylate cyclase
LEPALEHLEHARILRPIPSSESDGVGRREIYHDVLAPAVIDWRRRHVDEERTRRLAQARERARRLEVRNRRLAAAVVALVVVVGSLALYLWNPGPLQRAELRTVDARFSLRAAHAVDPRIVLIAVDDKTLDRLHLEGNDRVLQRAAYARLLDRLRADRPAAIALDVIFQGSQDPRNDRALREAIRATGPLLVLACKNYEVGLTADGSQTLRAADLFMTSRALKAARVGTGYAGLPEDVDDHNRRADYLVELFRPASASAQVSTRETVSARTFAFSTADVVRKGALGRHVDELPTASRRAQGEQSERTTWIDYVGPPGEIRRVSAVDILNGRVRPGAFADNVVVIGVVAQGNPDVHRTPLDRGAGMPGPEVQANALNTMLGGAPLRDASRLIDILAILLLACIPAVAALGRSRAILAAAIAATAVLFLGAAQLAFHGGRIVAVVVPLVALAASTLAVTALAAARIARSRAARRRSAPDDQLSPV